MHISPDLKLNALEDALWQTTRDAASPIEIRPSCALSLRAWITIGVQRMERQRRLAPEDLAIAHANLRKLIGLMKKEAVFLGKPDCLDNATFHAAHRRLRRQASLTAFALWPFWPHNFVATN
ncbi:MAG: hypothetical protein JO151_20815 [Verrucomicrobia bacterium]|jgi:hypothetical protein|nr:hypothetical protein [Verrucomicrobiota bacterium]